jgi:hypothetical protein
MKKKTAHSEVPTTTVITMVVDESYSMLPLMDATMHGFNEYVATVRKTCKGTSYFSAITFDTRGIRKLQVGAPLEMAIELGPHNYQPTGGTPLLDATMNAIHATDEVIRKHGPAKAIVVIQTDGEENSSQETKLPALQLAIKQRQELGWEFVFIGAGINAFQDAQKFGINTANTMSYAPTGRGTGAVFGAMAVNTVSYARGLTGNMNFTACQSADAGEDPHLTAKKMQAGNAKPLNTIDLTGGG